MSKPIQSIERAAAILRLFSRRPGRLSLAELAAELSLPKATVYGIVRTLDAVGYVEQDRPSGNYRIGAALLHLGRSYLDSSELRARSIGWSHWLASHTHEAVRVSTLHGREVLVLHHAFRPDDSPQTSDVGALLPTHATAMGKVLLVHHPSLIAELGADELLPRFTDETVTDLPQLAEELGRVREQGWASEVEELVRGEASCAAPIHDRRGIAVGAIAISGPIERICDGSQLRGELISYVREAGRTISRDLGAMPWKATPDDNSGPLHRGDVSHAPFLRVSVDADEHRR